MKKLIVIFLALLVLIPFMGIEHHVGDHETGDADEFFIKNKPSLVFYFSNPAIEDLEIIPFDKLTIDKKNEVMSFCSIRYGLQNISDCYNVMKNMQL